MAKGESYMSHVSLRHVAPQKRHYCPRCHTLMYLHISQRTQSAGNCVFFITHQKCISAVPVLSKIKRVTSEYYVYTVMPLSLSCTVCRNWLPAKYTLMFSLKVK